MSTTHPHRNLFQIVRRYNGRNLLICQTTTRPEAMAWLSYFRRINPAKSYEIQEPVWSRKGCQDCGAEIFKGRRLCAECEHENGLNAAQYAMDQDLLERGKALL